MLRIPRQYAIAGDVQVALLCERTYRNLETYKALWLTQKISLATYLKETTTTTTSIHSVAPPSSIECLMMSKWLKAVMQLVRLKQKVELETVMIEQVKLLSCSCRTL